MKYISFIFILILFIGCDSATTDMNRPTAIYGIGHEHLTNTELFYPTQEIGSIADANFPLIIFAHGYQQVYSDYRYLWEALVPKGYIFAFLTTQQGLSIDIDSYADDIITLHNELRTRTSSIVSGHLSEKSILMGHSTGGGAIYLAQAKMPLATTLISLAALGEPYGPIFGTTPIDVANNITVSTLILSGDKDCVTPMNIHQKPLFNAFGGEKSMIVIEGGDHCGFSDSINCPAAEAIACGLFFQGEALPDAAQRALVLQYITTWLDKN